MLKGDAHPSTLLRHYGIGGPGLSTVRAVARLVTLTCIFLISAATYAQNSLSTRWLYSPLGAVGSVAYSPDGTLAAVCGGGPRSAVAGYRARNGGASGGGVGSGVQIYNAATGALVRCLPSSVDGLGGPLAFSPNGHLLAVGGGYTNSQSIATGVIELWNASTGVLVASLNTRLSGYIGTLAFSPDGSTLADAGVDPYEINPTSNVVEFWSVSTSKFVGTLATDAVEGVTSIAYAPQGNALAIGGFGAQVDAQDVGVVELWNLTTRKLIKSLSADATAIYAIALTPDGSKLACCGCSVYASAYSYGANSFAGLIEEWDVSTGQQIFAQNTLATNPYCVAFSPDGQSIAVGGWNPAPGASGFLETLSAATGTIIATFPTPTEAAYFDSVSFSPDGTQLLGGGADWVSVGGFYKPMPSPSGFAEVEIWNVASQQLATQLNPATNYADSVAMLPDGITVAVGGDRADPVTYVVTPTVGLQNVLTGQTTQNFPTTLDQIVTVALSPDGTMLADTGTEGYHGATEVWNVATGALIARFKSAASFLSAVAFSPDGKSLVDGGYYTYPMEPNAGVIEVWSIATGTSTTLPTATGNVTCLAFSHDGKFLADGGYPVVGSVTGNLELWNLASGAVTELPTTENIVNAVAFAPDGSTLVDAGWTVDDSTLECWNLANGSVATAGPFANGTRNVYGLKFTSGGNALLANTSSGLQAFVVPGYTPLANYPAYNVGGATSVAVSPDQSTLVIVAGCGEILTASNPLFGSAGVSGLSISSPSVTAGTDLTGTVTLAKSAPIGGNIVNLSSGSAAASVPAFITVPAGAKRANFTIATNGVAVSTTTVITAVSSGVKAKATLTVNPAKLTKLAVSPASVVCGKSSLATVTLNGPAPAGGALVTLSSNEPNAVVPASVRVAAGTTSATFTVKTVAGSAGTKATITAKWGSATQTASLTITPASLSSLTLSRSSVVGGSTSPVVGTLTLIGPAPAGGYSVTLSSSNSSEASVPASVTVASGASSATFTVTHYAVKSAQKVVITATFAGSSARVDLTVSP